MRFGWCLYQPLGCALGQYVASMDGHAGCGYHHWLFVVQDVPQGCTHAEEPRFGKAMGVDVEKAAVKAAVIEEDLGEEEFKLTRKNLPVAIGIGLTAGLASGYVGVGGGFLMVPLFISVLGVMMRKASGTSLVAIMILAIPGVVYQGMLGNIDYLAGIAMAAGSIPGAVIGANLVRRVPERQLRIAFGVFLLISAVVLLGNEVAAL